MVYSFFLVYKQKAPIDIFEECNIKMNDKNPFPNFWE